MDHRAGHAQTTAMLVTACCKPHAQSYLLPISSMEADKSHSRVAGRIETGGRDGVVLLETRGAPRHTCRAITSVRFTLNGNTNSRVLVAT